MSFIGPISINGLSSMGNWPASLLHWHVSKESKFTCVHTFPLITYISLNLQKRHLSGHYHMVLIYDKPIHVGDEYSLFSIFAQILLCYMTPRILPSFPIFILATLYSWVFSKGMVCMVVLGIHKGSLMIGNFAKLSNPGKARSHNVWKSRD